MIQLLALTHNCRQQWRNGDERNMRLLIKLQFFRFLMYLGHRAFELPNWVMYFCIIERRSDINVQGNISRHKYCPVSGLRVDGQFRYKTRMDVNTHILYCLKVEIGISVNTGILADIQNTGRFQWSVQSNAPCPCHQCPFLLYKFVMNFEALICITVHLKILSFLRELVA